MKFTVVTLLPELIDGALQGGVVGRAKDAGTIAVGTVNPRDFTTDRHRTVDDTPYGGGPGMVMKPEPLLAAISSIGPAAPAIRRIFLAPTGAPLDQAMVRRLATYAHLVLVCGRYEGIDQRVLDLAIDEEISIGDFVLSGGELGALVIVDAVARLVPGVLGEATSADDESFSAGLLEYPQYTRPAVLTTDDGRELAAPAILASGNHAAIASWRRQRAMQRTAERRPALWDAYRPSKAERKLLVELPALDVAARTYVALVHHPVVDKVGAIITSALTNFDIHDIARSSATYGLAAYFIVTPVTSQRDKAQHIADAWIADPVHDHRASALAQVRTADSVATAVAEITVQTGIAPRVIATSARAESFPGLPRFSAASLVGSCRAAGAAAGPLQPLLVLFGTSWGLADRLLPQVEGVLAPIDGASDWNHLSVRSAVAITLDRMFGRRELRTPAG